LEKRNLSVPGFVVVSRFLFEVGAEVRRAHQVVLQRRQEGRGVKVCVCVM
jgi:hypothetical protein